MVEWRLFFLEADESPIKVFNDNQVEKAFAAFHEAAAKNLHPTLICKSCITGKLQIILSNAPNLDKQAKSIMPPKKAAKEKKTEEMVPA